MENLRELLNIYFSEEKEEEKAAGENRNGDIFESKYENIFNTFNKEEKYITNVFENILKEGKNTIFSGGSSEKIIEKAYEGIGKIGDISASACYNYNVSDTYEPKEFSAKSEIGRNIVKGNDYAGNEQNIVNENKYSGLNENHEKVLKLYDEAEKANSGDSENIFSISQRETDTNIYGGSENNRFDGFVSSEPKALALTEDFFDFDNKKRGAEGSVSGADLSAFVPSLNSYTESLSNSSNSSSENINDVLNNYYSGADGSRSITNNISPSFNFYGGSSGGDIDIDDIAEKIGEMLMEAAAGSAEGYYG